MINIIIIFLFFFFFNISVISYLTTKQNIILLKVSNHYLENCRHFEDPNMLRVQGHISK